MISPYVTEIQPPTLPVGVGANGSAARRTQEWLGLQGFGVVIDSDFGGATKAAVAAFQGSAGLPATGAVDAGTWTALAQPLIAVTAAIAPGAFGDAVVRRAQLHLGQKAREVGGDNCGPWVRHYCRGHSVAWCQGFASTIWADVARAHGAEAPLDLVLEGIWCLFVPRMVQEARAKGRFVDGRAPGATPRPGSMFFLRGGPHGYSHVGLVERVIGDGTMSTIEGNTNDEGSANGYEVARRIRRIASCDFGQA